MGDVTPIGGITFKFDAARINRLFQLLPEQACQLHCSSAIHTITVCCVNGMIFIRDPEKDKIFKFKREDEKLGSFIVNALGELIGISVFYSGKQNVPSMTPVFLVFVEEELNQMAAQYLASQNAPTFTVFSTVYKVFLSQDKINSSYPTVLNAAPSHLMEGILWVQGDLITMAKDAHHEEMVEFFLKHGASKEKALENIQKKNAPLFFKYIDDENINMINYMLSCKDNIVDVNSKEHHPLIYAIIGNKQKSLHELLCYPFIDVNQPNAEGAIPIIVAIQNKNEEMVCQLLDTGQINLLATNLAGKNILELCYEYNMNKALHIIHNLDDYRNKVEFINIKFQK